MALDAEHNNTPNWVSLQEYAAFYKVSDAGVRKWLREGRLHTIKMGAHHRIDLNSTPTP